MGPGAAVAVAVLGQTGQAIAVAVKTMFFGIPAWARPATAFRAAPTTSLVFSMLITPEKLLTPERSRASALLRSGSDVAIHLCSGR
jgi:hypothetical protein